MSGVASAGSVRQSQVARVPCDCAYLKGFLLDKVEVRPSPTSTHMATTSYPYFSFNHAIATDVSRPPEYASTSFFAMNYSSPNAPASAISADKMAFCACKRFSAWSKTMECSPSIISAVTSSPR